MNSVIKQVTNQTTDIKKLEKRINDLEDLSTTLSNQLNEEIVKRKNLEDNSITNQTGNQAQFET